MGRPKATYDWFDIQIWREALQTELCDSGLPGAIEKLTKEMAESARINALDREADTIIGQLHKMSSVQKYVLLLCSPPSFDLVFQTKARGGKTKRRRVRLCKKRP